MLLLLYANILLGRNEFDGHFLYGDDEDMTTTMGPDG